MKLDERINENYRIYTCFDTEEAKKYYLNTSGYFADYIEDFVDLDCLDRCELKIIESEFKYPYCIYGDSFKFFLPCAFVKEETEQKQEKKYRPYKDIKEFPGGIGSVLTYRSKSEPSVHILTSVESIATQNNDLIFVCLGGLRFSPLVLLKDYEYLNNTGYEWLPFGVEETN